MLGNLWSRGGPGPTLPSRGIEEKAPRTAYVSYCCLFSAIIWDDKQALEALEVPTHERVPPLDLDPLRKDILPVFCPPLLRILASLPCSTV
jgi:hypothetical protein